MGIGSTQQERSRPDTTGNGFLPKYFGVEGMQFSAFPQGLSILYSNANLLDLDLARLGPSASACTSMAASPASSSGATQHTIDLICLLHVCLS
jgi:hypothetical protein